MVVTTFVGTFLNDETITATKADSTTLSASLTGMVTNVTIVDGGQGYIVDEEILFTDPGETTNTATLKIATVNHTGLSLYKNKWSHLHY